MDKDQRAVIATALMSSRPSIKEAGLEEFGKGAGTVYDAVAERLKPEAERRPDFDFGSQVSSGFSQIGKSLPGMVPLQTRNFSTPDLPETPVSFGRPNNYNINYAPPGQVVIPAAKLQEIMDRDKLTYQQMKDKAKSLGWTRAHGQGSYTANIPQAELSPVSKRVLEDARSRHLFEGSAKAKERAGKGLREEWDKSSWWQKFMGPQVQSTAMRRDAMNLYNQAMALKAAGRNDEAKDLFKKYETLRRAITAFEEQAEKQYAPFRNKALAGGGILLLFLMMLKALGGGSR